MAQIVTGLIIIFGAVVHATAQLKIARDTDNDKFTWIDFVILLPLSIFAGWVFVIVSSLFFTGDAHQWLAGAMGSFMGITGLNRLFNNLLDMAVKTRKK